MRIEASFLAESKITTYHRKILIMRLHLQNTAIKVTATGFEKFVLLNWEDFRQIGFKLVTPYDFQTVIF